MLFDSQKLNIAALFLFTLLLPAAAVADMNGQEDQQDKEDRQEQLSANNTAFRGARLLERGQEAYVGSLSAPKNNQSASVFWSGDTLNLEVRSDKTGNRMALKIEFFWFQTGKDRNSDFYVAILRGNSSPNLGDSDCTHLGDGTWQLGVDKLAQFVHAKADPSGQGGAIRWDWSIPFQTYRWEPKQDIKIQQHYALNAGVNAEGSVNGSAGLSSSPTGGGGESSGGTNGKQIQAKGSISGNAGAEASHKVSTNYTITLYRWELQVSSGPSGVEWGLVPLDPKKATDNAYHEYYLVMQSETKGQPLVIPEIEFGGNFECSRWSILPNKDEKIKAKATNIRLTPPPLPDCKSNERIKGDECVPKCPNGEVYENGSCKPEEDSNNSDDDNSCKKDDDCSSGKICESGKCVTPNCMISDECDSDEICQRGRCRPVECKRDADCNNGEKCSSAGKCVRATETDSDSDSDSNSEDDEEKSDFAPDAGSRADTSGRAGQHNFEGSACSMAGRSGGSSLPGGGLLAALLFGIAGLFRLRGRRDDEGTVKKTRSRPTFPTSLVLIVGLAFWTVLGVGCGGASAPKILPINNKTVNAGETLEFEVVAKNAKSLKAKNLPKDARFDVHGSGEGRFTWSPLLSQTGEHQVEFVASNKEGQNTARMTIKVSGGCDGPEILTPTAWVIEEKGQTLQRSIQVKENHCSKKLEWKSSGMPEEMSFTPPENGHRATVHWKPAAKQWNKQKEWQFDVTVTNGEGKSTTESFVIRLGEKCPNTPEPSVESTTPSAQQGKNNFPVKAQVTAEKESDLEEVYLFYAGKADPEPKDFFGKKMERRSDSSDVFQANVVLDKDLKHGQSVDVTYRICAVNNDESGEKPCSVQNCTDDLQFTAQLGTASGLCTSCERDGDCGGPTDRCVPYGPSSSHCGLDCSSTGSCPRGYECMEINGGYKQCVRTVDCGSSGEHRAAKSGDLVINEVLAYPPDDANGDGTQSGTADQFIEIISTASEIVDISKYKIQKGHDRRFTFPAGTTVAPGQSVVVFGGGNPAKFEDMGTNLVFSARDDQRADVGMLQFRRAGDTIRLVDRDDEEILKLSYGDKADSMKDDLADQGESITRSPQVQGSSWVRHSNSPGAGSAKFSPGTSSCGKKFPREVHGGCGGSQCLGRATDKDVKSNDSRQNAVCVSDLPIRIEGSLHYVWQEPDHPGPDPVDYYEVQLSEGETIDVATFPGPEPDIYNTKLKIVASDGTVMAENLHRHEVRDWYSEIDDFTAPSSGMYYVVVTTPEGQTSLKGSYILRVESASKQ